MKNKILSEMAVPGPHGHTVAVPSAKDKPNADPAQFAGTRFDWNDLTFFLNLAAIIHRGRIFALVRAARGAHDLHAQPEFSPQG